MKVVITARDFSEGDTKALTVLSNEGLEIVDHSKKGLGAGAPIEVMSKLVEDADFVIAGLEPFSEDILQHCSSLKLISRRGIGFDTIDIEACKKYGVSVCRTTGLVESAVAEHVIAYILYFARRIDLQNSFMKQRNWNRIMTPGAKTRTLGLIGFGGIGKAIAKRAAALEMQVVYNCRHPNQKWEQEYHASYMPFEKVLAESDYISVNLPLTNETRGMFSYEQFSRMKAGSIFINVSRSDIMNVEALKEALDTGHLGGAAIDVFPQEPYTESPLVSCENAILTPHTAPYTSETFNLMNLRAAQNIVDFIHNKLDPVYIVI